VDPEQVDPEQVDPEQVDPEQVDPEQVDPEQVDPELYASENRLNEEPPHGRIHASAFGDSSGRRCHELSSR
jgi:hypothetical protein